MMSYAKSMYKKGGQGNLYVCLCLTSYLYRNFAFLSGKPLNDPVTEY